MSQYRESQCKAMLDATARAGQAGMSRREYAQLLNIKKGKHLNGLIAELLTRNLVFETRVKDIHNRPLFIYMMPEFKAEVQQNG